MVVYVMLLICAHAHMDGMAQDVKKVKRYRYANNRYVTRYAGPRTTWRFESEGT